MAAPGMAAPLVYGVDALQCSRCPGKLQPIGQVLNETLISETLSFPGLPTQAPEAKPARAPPSSTSQKTGPKQVVVSEEDFSQEPPLELQEQALNQERPHELKEEDFSQERPHERKEEDFSQEPFSEENFSQESFRDDDFCQELYEDDFSQLPLIEDDL